MDYRGKTVVTHHPRGMHTEFPQFMNSLCGVPSVSSALNPALVTCPECQRIEQAWQRQNNEACLQRSATR
jgi:hypothetical protein